MTGLASTVVTSTSDLVSALDEWKAFGPAHLAEIRDAIDCALWQHAFSSSSSVTCTTTNVLNSWTVPSNSAMTSGTSTGYIASKLYGRVLVPTTDEDDGPDLAWLAWNGEVHARQITEAERLARNRQREEIRRAEEVRHQEERKARMRAKKLLVQNLSPAQRQSLETHRYFDVQVGGKTYRIHQGTHGNVRLVEAGREVVSYCIQPDNVPAEDAMLAQKLTLECDEATFLRIANARRLTQ